eukprot:8787206-Pyramimonas_sp.AAC.2
MVVPPVPSFPDHWIDHLDVNPARSPNELPVGTLQLWSDGAAARCPSAAGRAREVRSVWQ